MTARTIQAIAVVLGYLSEVEVKSLQLKALHTLEMIPRRLILSECHRTENAIYDAKGGMQSTMLTQL